MKRFQMLSLIVTTAGLLAAGCTGKGNAENETEPKVPVETMTAELGSIVQSVSYNGSIQAETEVQVFSKIADRILAINVDEGSRVERGDPVARILATSIEQGVRQAEAALAAARAQEANVRIEFDRAQRLLNENAMSRQQFDAIQTQVEAVTAQREQAEAMAASAHSMLDDATVTAPIAGIVANRNYDPGDVASPARPLLSIIQTARVKIILDVTESDLGALRLNQEAVVTVTAFQGRSFRGKISLISPVLNARTRMARVEALIDNRDRSLRSGMFGRVELITGRIDSVIVIPRHAVIEATSMQYNQGQERVSKDYFVFIVEGNRAVQRKLAPVSVNHRSIAVANGIEPGERIVTLGQNALRDGAAVLEVSREQKKGAEP